MKKFLIFFLLLGLNSIAFSQSALLNQFNDKGQKHGKWVLYMDQNWKKLDDSLQASFRRYTYFDHGNNIYPMGPCGGKGFTLSGDLKSRMLDGEYKWMDAKGKLSSVHLFKNGEYVSCKEYFSSGVISQHFDYTKKCEGQEHGWTVFIYDRKGNLTLTSPTCKDKNGNWPKMRG
ncbi:MAG: hypothetical protein M3R27_05705 [Bacteroidota bacterium]|nr:hypothetical protein [Bacteroidota bacterium]